MITDENTPDAAEGRGGPRGGPRTTRTGPGHGLEDSVTRRSRHAGFLDGGSRPTERPAYTLNVKLRYLVLLR